MYAHPAARLSTAHIALDLGYRPPGMEEEPVPGEEPAPGEEAAPGAAPTSYFGEQLVCMSSEAGWLPVLRPKLVKHAVTGSSATR